MKKILIIRFSSIGDIVLTTPIIRCIKNQIPDAEIHYLTKKQFAPVLEANSYIDKLFSINEKIAEVLPELKKESYDFVIDLHKNFRSKGIIFNLKKPASSFSKLNFKKWLVVNLKINRLPDIHIVDRYFEAVVKLNVINDDKGLDYFIPEKDKVDMNSLPALHQKGFIGWVIGGKHNTKIYPEEKIIEVCKNTVEPIILLGGPEDAEKGNRIAGSTSKHVYNSCGMYNINQSASLVKQSKKIITNDTGLMHIAAAFKKEIISFWGNTIPEFGMYPYLPGDEKRSHILQVNDLSCRPCSKLGYEECPKKHFDCMNKIETKKIIQLIE